ncbi:hypothetical protein GCM10027088_32660 [Nocardia goodfellowii]
MARATRVLATEPSLTRPPRLGLPTSAILNLQTDRYEISPVSDTESFPLVTRGEPEHSTAPE